MLLDSTGKDEIALPSQLCADLGIGRELKRRILSALTYVGLIAIRQAPGRLARVRLRSADTAEEPEG